MSILMVMNSCFSILDNVAFHEEKSISGIRFQEEIEAVKSALSSDKKVIEIGSPKASSASSDSLKSSVGAAKFTQGPQDWNPG